MHPRFRRCIPRVARRCAEEEDHSRLLPMDDTAKDACPSGADLGKDRTAAEPVVHKTSTSAENGNLRAERATRKTARTKQHTKQAEQKSGACPTDAQEDFDGFACLFLASSSFVCRNRRQCGLRVGLTRLPARLPAQPAAWLGAGKYVAIPLDGLQCLSQVVLQGLPGTGTSERTSNENVVLSVFSVPGQHLQSEAAQASSRAIPLRSRADLPRGRQTIPTCSITFPSIPDLQGQSLGDLVKALGCGQEIGSSTKTLDTDSAGSLPLANRHRTNSADMSTDNRKLNSRRDACVLLHVVLPKSGVRRPKTCETEIHVAVFVPERSADRCVS